MQTPGGIVEIRLHLDRLGRPSDATVEMGMATFEPATLPCTLRVAELIERPIRVLGRSLKFTGVSVGNPHCVIYRDKGQSWSRRELLELGPLLENHRYFPKRINVQLAVPVGPRSIYILIWERGAGETEASGSSSCAAASAAVRLGLVKSGKITVRSPGGSLHIEVGDDFHLTMKGPVAEVASGRLSAAFVQSLS